MTDRIPLHGANGVAPSRLCSFENCPRVAGEFPVISFGTIDRLPGGKCDYRLEVPKPVCEEHRVAFRPAVYLGDQAQKAIDDVLAANGKSAADYTRLFVSWKTLSGPEWQEMKNLGQARLWF